MIDSKLRSLIKTASYRFVGIFVTAFVAWIIMRDPLSALQIGLADTLVKFMVFYFHERAWNKIKFGRAKPPEYQI
jgi:uncharacterized membrane protein